MAKLEEPEAAENIQELVARIQTMGDHILAMNESILKLPAQLKGEFHQALEQELAALHSRLATGSASGKVGGEAAKSNSLPHGLCQDKACVPCQTATGQVAKNAMMGMMAIPGVREAIDYNQAMAKMGYQGESWHKVPQVASAVELHQIMMTPVSMPV